MIEITELTEQDVSCHIADLFCPGLRSYEDCFVEMLNRFMKTFADKKAQSV